MAPGRSEIEQQLDHHRRLLHTHRTNLNTLQQQAASFGIAVPLELVNQQRQLEQQIATHQQQIARLEELLAAAPPETNAPAAPISGAVPAWMEGLSLGAGGDMIIGQAGANAQNVAIGKDIVQQNTSVPNDTGTTLVSLLDELARIVQALPAASQALAEFQLGVLRDELLKTSAADAPSASAIVRAGSGLLATAPQLAPTLARLLTTSAAQGVLQRAGSTAEQWARSVGTG